MPAETITLYVCPEHGVQRQNTAMRCVNGCQNRPMPVSYVPEGSQPAGIIEVRADEVEVGDSVRCSARSRFGGGPEGEWFEVETYDETGTPYSGGRLGALALAGRSGPAVYADTLVIVRRPSPDASAPAPPVPGDVSANPLNLKTVDSEHDHG